MAAARKSSRYGHRDATMILIGYRHGLRASELCDLQWSQLELATGGLHVRRAKNGSPSVHPMQADEIRALRRLQREQGPSSHVFMTERDGPKRNRLLNWGAYRFGEIVAEGRINPDIASLLLEQGAKSCGLWLDDGPQQCLATIRSGIAAGVRDASERIANVIPFKKRRQRVGRNNHE